MKREARQRYVIVEGIKKKCRKTDRHFLKMTDVPTEVDEEKTGQYKREAMALLSESMKEWRRASLHLDWASYDDESGMVSLMLMDQRNVRISLEKNG